MTLDEELDIDMTSRRFRRELLLAICKQQRIDRALELRLRRTRARGRWGR